MLHRALAAPGAAREALVHLTMQFQPNIEHAAGTTLIAPTRACFVTPMTVCGTRTALPSNGIKREPFLASVALSGTRRGARLAILPACPTCCLRSQGKTSAAKVAGVAVSP